MLCKLQCWGVLLVWMIAGRGPIALAVGAGGGCLDIFSLIYLFSFLSPSLWETARYRLKYCLKGPLNPKQPTNQSSCFSSAMATVGKCVGDVSVLQTEYSVFTFFLLLNPKKHGSKKAMDRSQQAMFNPL